MNHSWLTSLFQTCPKTGRVVGLRRPTGMARLMLPVFGLAALIWFVVRVVPKPSRAAYPCQRMALPLASGFVLWLVSLGGSSVALHHARTRLHASRHMTVAALLVIAVAGLTFSAVTLSFPASAGVLAARPAASYTPHPTNSPIGTAKGLAPGRVVWVHDRAVTDWSGPTGPGTPTHTPPNRWYSHVNQAVASSMLSGAIRRYAGAPSESGAWTKIIRQFTGGDRYRPGQKVFIKINLTTAAAGSGTGGIDGSYNWAPSGGVTFDSIGPTAELLYALLHQLVDVVGVAQSDITVGDPTGDFYNELYTPLHNTFANVNYLDNYGGSNRTRAQWSSVRQYWSTSEASGKTNDYVLSAMADATYVINLALLKSHDRNGITLTAKNQFGSMIRTPSGSCRTGCTGTWLELHHFLPSRPVGSSDPYVPTMGHYRPVVDLNGHANGGGKTLLYIVDGIFGGKNWNSVPSKWAIAPFNDDWPKSLFVSMDQVAIDSVGFDFLSQQWPDEVLVNEGVQDYLHEMAQANNPPSGTFYDPEGDGTRLGVMGVHEHWNNATDKQYTRNLGTGTGIELVYVRN
jgi:hypothetical protein